jgi:hypothetical protein
MQGREKLNLSDTSCSNGSFIQSELFSPILSESFVESMAGNTPGIGLEGGG